MSGPSAVSLKSMGASDAVEFLAASLERFADDLARTNHWPLDIAREHAKEIERDVLPDHESTAGHSFMWIVGGGEPVGRVWLGPMPDGRSMLYVWEIIIDDHRRGQGLGGEALTAVLKFAFESGLPGVGLTVWDTNPAARRLYERMGFVVDSEGDGRSLMVCQAR